MELIDMVMKQAGLDRGQAEGGVGAIFKLARERLPGGDFAKLAGAIPGIDQLINKAPADTGGGLLGGLGSLAGKLTGNAAVGNLGQLADAFSKLGIDKSKIDDVLKVVMGFLQSKGGGLKEIAEKLTK